MMSVLTAMGVVSAGIVPVSAQMSPVRRGVGAAEARRDGGQVRRDISLDKGWRSIADEKDSNAFRGFEGPGYQDKRWRSVDLPHNWDAYGGYRRLRHGNLHGYAWYRRSFRIGGDGFGRGRLVKGLEKDRRVFLWFEGVGSYATVWVNGILVGRHAGGRTSFTLDITDALKPAGVINWLAVRADHPAGILDLPWVCGACSDERGFSEGSQPMGIFRPVHLITTSVIRIQPFGVHIWNDTAVSDQTASLFLETEIKNYGRDVAEVSVINRLVDSNGAVAAIGRSRQVLPTGETKLVRQDFAQILHPHLWSVDHPYLYTLVTELWARGRLVDRVNTPYGIRCIHWPDMGGAAAHVFLLNGKPVFINGIAEYEHMLGKSHAFTAAEIRARVLEIKAAGFNAFRDAHQPHNLLYQQYWDKEGVLWWPQLSAHIWYDSPAFRKNFLTLLTEWVKERRNSPSLVLWGLQNESKLPADFAKECVDLIRQLDPTASSQRKVTTCNGGSGTDWDVPQNWTGTYGGDPSTYADDLRKQVLVGEYGAWRTLDLHTEVGAGGAVAQTSGAAVSRAALGTAGAKTGNDEDHMTALMETKIRLAATVKDLVAGHFAWLFSSHDNPGRVQSGEGWRDLDRIGPVNYKGLFTSWGEPLDAYYMYRSNFVSSYTFPMVYIVSHTWPDRWTAPGKKSGIVVYSNCDEVELFNDVHALSLGRRRRGGIGTHFQWDSVDIRYNVLYAVGYVKGKAVAKDMIVLHHLPAAPQFSARSWAGRPSPKISITAGQPGYHYLYRVNCGGPDYKDIQGNVWMADRHLVTTGDGGWGSRSWTDDYPGLPSFFASQRRTADLIAGTMDAPLFQDFRYGLDRLVYAFPVQDGDYLLELYFTEPWFGVGGGMDCTGWRLFDVAVNDKVVLHDLDIWKEAGHDRAMKKTIAVKVSGGQLVLSFPHVAAGQAILSAIAIATRKRGVVAAPPSRGLINGLKVKDPAMAKKWSVQSWLDTGQPQFAGDGIAGDSIADGGIASGAVADGAIAGSSPYFSSLPPKLYGAEWIRGPEHMTASSNGVGEKAGEIKPGDTLVTFRVAKESDVYISLDARVTERPVWLKDYERTDMQIENDGNKGNIFQVYRKRWPAGPTIWLGGNGRLPGGISSGLPDMYTVIACPVTMLEPAYDSKPVTTYKAAKARVSGDTVEWDLSVGVADTYSLTIKYRYLPVAAGQGVLELRMVDGTLLKKDSVTLLSTPATKWNYLNSSTGTMINAGHYTVRLIAALHEGGRADELQVQ